MYKHLGLTVWIALFAFIAVPFGSLAHVGDGSHIHCSDCGAEAHMNPADCISNSEPEEDDLPLWRSVLNIFSSAHSLDSELEDRGIYDSVFSWTISTADSVSDWFWDSADYYYDAYMDAWDY